MNGDNGIPRAKVEKECSCTILWDCGSPFYDSFEVVSIHYIIDKHRMKLPYDLRYQVIPLPPLLSSSSSSSSASSTRSNMRGNFGKARQYFSSMASFIAHLIGKKTRAKGEGKSITF